MQLIEIPPFDPTTGKWALVVDTLDVVTPADARALLAAGYSARGGYVDHVTPDEIKGQQGEGLAFFPISYAHEYDGAHIVKRLVKLGLPHGLYHWLDDEGEMGPAEALIAKLNAETAIVKAAGFKSGGYFGSLQLLTSAELTNLALDRYWRGCSKIVDRFGNVAEPARGYCQFQGRPFNVVIAGKKYDVSVLFDDYKDDRGNFAAA